MKALFRIVLAAVGVLGLLAVVVVIYATTFLDPNDLKPRLAEAVQERTGLELSLDGPLSWTFYPRLGVTVEDASARLPDQRTDEAPFAALDRVDARIRFAPLLAGNIEVDGFTLEGLRLYLTRDESGRANWESLAETLAHHQDAAPAARNTAAGPQQVATAGERPLAMNVANVEVIDGRVHYVDQARGGHLTVDELALKATGVTTESPFPVEASFRFDSTQPTSSGQVTLSTRAALDPAADEWALEGLSLDGSARLTPQDDGDGQRFALAVERLSAEQAGRYRLAGGELSTSLQPSALDGETLPLDAEFDATFDVREGSAMIEPLRITSDDQLRLDASARIEGIGDDPLWQGRFEMAPSDWRTWLDRRGLLPTTGDDQALSATGFTAAFEGDGERTYFEPLTLSLDDTTLSGRMALGFASPLLHLTLEGESLDLGRYLPPAALAVPEGTGEAASESASGEDSDAARDSMTGEVAEDGAVAANAGEADGKARSTSESDTLESDTAESNTAAQSVAKEAVVQARVAEAVVTEEALAEERGNSVPPAWAALLRDLDFELNLALAALDVRKLRLEPFATEVDGEAGRLRLEALKAGLYGGSLSATGSLDTRMAPMALALAPRLEGVALEPLLTDLLERDAPMRGTLESEGAFSARLGGTTSPIATLGGQGRFVISDGALPGLDLPARVCHAAAALQGREPSEEAPSGDTRFDRLRGSLVIDSGVIGSDDMDLVLPGMALDASGEIDLVQRRFDVDLGASLDAATAIDGCTISERLAGLRLPLRCTGEFEADPLQWCRPDGDALEALLRSSALDGGGERLEAEVERHLDESLGEEGGRSLRNAIRGLFE